MKPLILSTYNLTKTFGGIPAIQTLDLEVFEGEILVLVGPSGCGKTTLLRLLAGLEQPDSGEIAINGKTVTSSTRFVPPEKRHIGMVFQDYALFPHLSVQRNIEYGLKNFPKTERQQRVTTSLEMVGLLDYGPRFPHELSGGERQRVALARAMAPKPVVILLDEPFSNLDADRRSQMREDVREILRESGMTAIFVTHDQEEALFLGDRLAVINQGRLEQVAAPDEIFHQPTSRFVAEFMGDTDFLPGVITSRGIETEIGQLSQVTDFQEGTAVELAVRADDLKIWPDPRGNAVVERRFFKGAQNLYRLRLPSGRVLHSLQPHTQILSTGLPVNVIPDPGHDLAVFEINSNGNFTPDEQY